jgi:dGTPase
MKKFSSESATENNPKWQACVSRLEPLYSRGNDIRTEFGRDYTRILHSTAYRRLKHKTQVFFSPQNDHICTRIEHINHVESISYTIADYLGLNVELTKAISVAHDLGHSPFGHQGEAVLSEIAKRDVGERFWHEKNGINFVDNIELLEDNEQNKQNLNLTYAVRDGIVSHCGEVDQNGLKPRKEAIDLSLYTMPNEYAPFTYEACVVKISDKISYVGRDIEDAIALSILDDKKLNELTDIISTKDEKLNNTIIINKLIGDLCQNSSIENGLCFSDDGFKMLNAIKKFNYENIYKNERLKASNQYFSLVLNQIYDTLKKAYAGKNTSLEIKKLSKFYPNMSGSFLDWLHCYWDLADRTHTNLKNKIIYLVSQNEKDYNKAILDYISGMTDKYAIETYNEIIKF